MTRWLPILLLCAAITATAAAPSAAITPFDCTRVISPAQWKAVLGTSIKVRYGENDHDCNWFHRLGSRPSGGIEGYPAAERNWRKKFRDDRTGIRRIAFTCKQVESTRNRLRSFGGDFAWEVEYRTYRVPDPNDGSCPSAKTLTQTSHEVDVVHHGRFLAIYTSPNDKAIASATLSQLESLAHKAVRRF